MCGSDLWPYRGVRPTKRPRRIGHEPDRRGRGRRQRGDDGAAR
nr:hypothetical protein [Angustibacter aerolatus]